MVINLASLKKVLIRVDYNVPIQNGKILDLTRIESSVPTINYFLKKNMHVVLMTHLGRPQKRDKNYSLNIILNTLEKILNQNILFVSDILKGNNTQIPQTHPSITLLENLRFYSGEKNNDEKFAKKLSAYGDIYVNDAFGVCHRQHASVSAIGKFFPQKKYRGILLEKELNELKKLKRSKISPYTIIVGGSKIGSKIHMLKEFIDVADNILIGGGMAFPFIKHLGGEIGDSICKNDELAIVSNFLNQIKNSKTKVFLPTDALITDDIEQKNDQKYVDIMSIPKSYKGVDVGPDTIKRFSSIIIKSKLIMWNGPMGISEIKEFSKGTQKLAKLITDQTKKGTYSLIGGGDTVSDISRLGLKEKFSYVSTGGGAMLEFFKNKHLPALIELESLKLQRF